MLLASVKAHSAEELLWGCACRLTDGTGLLDAALVGTSSAGVLKGLRILLLLILAHL